MAPLLLLALTLSSGPEAAAARLKTPPPTSASVAPERPAAEVAEEVRSLLGAIDTPIAPARWRALGAAARATLEQLVADGAQLPSRRAKALDALAALGGPADVPAFLALALDEAQPVVVRLAAVRAVGATAARGSLGQALRPALEGAGDSRIGAAAAQVVVAAEPGACGALEARVKAEDPAVRGQFEAAARACGWPER